ncbi:hypothetical protein ZEAMMB73_Zm00001d021874 [Zea mays]|uniref:Uncharacterized protein n=1 Tax=Zea mays TaxID=4577 RepID=A0A1D6IHE7_MAIZE|nr:hypothetical protein ZEAMMB73_Zm00001d021874 [Zea mays]
MTMPWGLAACIVDMVWAVLAGWVSTCLVIANEVARGMRSGEIGAVHEDITKWLI